MNWFIQYCTPVNIAVALLIAICFWLLWMQIEYRDRLWSLQNPPDDDCPAAADSTKDRPKGCGASWE